MREIVTKLGDTLHNRSQKQQHESAWEAAVVGSDLSRVATPLGKHSIEESKAN